MPATAGTKAIAGTPVTPGTPAMAGRPATARIQSTDASSSGGRWPELQTTAGIQATTGPPKGRQQSRDACKSSEVSNSMQGQTPAG